MMLWLAIALGDYYKEQSFLDKSVCGNFVKNLWLGSCMTFKRETLLTTVPFSKRMAAYDLWMGLFA